MAAPTVAMTAAMKAVHLVESSAVSMVETMAAMRVAYLVASKVEWMDLH